MKTKPSTAHNLLNELQDISAKSYRLQYDNTRLRKIRDLRRIFNAEIKACVKVIEKYRDKKPDGKIIEDFLHWAITNDYITFDPLLYTPEDVNVDMDVAEKLIKEYIINR